jgi:hypothetical protein
MQLQGSMAVHLWLAGEIARRGGPGAGEITFTFVATENPPDGLAYSRDGVNRPPDVAGRTRNRLVTEERGVRVRVSARGKVARVGARTPAIRDPPTPRHRAIERGFPGSAPGPGERAAVDAQHRPHPRRRD